MAEEKKVMFHEMELDDRILKVSVLLSVKTYLKTLNFHKLLVKRSDKGV